MKENPAIDVRPNINNSEKEHQDEITSTGVFGNNMPTMTQADLVAAAMVGDQEAFVALIQNYDKPLRSLAFKITGDAHLMQDVMQETYVKAYSNLSTFDHRSSFQTWIYRICHNAAIDQIRTRKREQPSEIYDQADDAPHSNERRIDVMRALGTLSAEHRSVVILVDEQGFTYDEAAAVLNVPSGTIASRLSHARRELRVVLGSYLMEKK